MSELLELLTFFGPLLAFLLIAKYAQRKNGGTVRIVAGGQEIDLSPNDSGILAFLQRYFAETDAPLTFPFEEDDRPCTISLTAKYEPVESLQDILVSINDLPVANYANYRKNGMRGENIVTPALRRLAGSRKAADRFIENTLMEQASRTNVRTVNEIRDFKAYIASFYTMLDSIQDADIRNTLRRTLFLMDVLKDNAAESGFTDRDSEPVSAYLPTLENILLKYIRLQDTQKESEKKDRVLKILQNMNGLLEDRIHNLPLSDELPVSEIQAKNSERTVSKQR